MQYTISESTLGLVLTAESAAGVCAVLLGNDAGALRDDVRRRFPGTELREGGVEMQRRAAGVVRALEHPAHDDLSRAFPLDLRGTGFQRNVWNALRDIPAGATATYTTIARRLGRPTSARAVARACAANPIAVLIPCHRVVRSDGAPAGYRWGLERKRTLLEREAAETAAGTRRSAPPL
jgi:AraC family transcriptional regulator of adaptative response/methylated-DNA-[protein]-cysteine methyltransferase